MKEILEMLGYDVKKINIDEIKGLNPDGIVLSPGPGNPDDSGICNAVIRNFCQTKHIFGGWLGHRGWLGESFWSIGSNTPVARHADV